MTYLEDFSPAVALAVLDAAIPAGCSSSGGGAGGAKLDRLYVSVRRAASGAGGEAAARHYDETPDVKAVSDELAADGIYATTVRTTDGTPTGLEFFVALESADISELVRANSSPSELASLK